VGGGGTQLQMDGVERQTQGAVQIDAGFGSNPNRALVVGGLLRALAHFGAGPDWAVLLRSTSGGFSRGDWGVALDLGGYQRWWGPESTGFTGTLWGGGPWGLQLGATASLGSEQARTFGLTLGIDWARATAHRQSGMEERNHGFPSAAEPRQEFCVSLNGTKFRCHGLREFRALIVGAS
jgi:hypothetical protein